ncbi:MAG: class I SAM-dependent RNA methyltransferase [Anaerolineales bacterium]|nr:class I SAM-dependent RNA methyltransferase [Anaerolineales bacterium]
MSPSQGVEPSENSPSVGDVVRVTFDRLAPSGEAIARMAGLVIFTPLGAPGDDADVRIIERKRTFARGQLLHVHRSGPIRVTPRCAYFGVCGGCDWQHITYADQLLWKAEVVAEQLVRLGRFAGVTVEPCIPSPLPYGYRNHTRLAVDEARLAGYRAARSHAIVPVERCPVLEPALEADLAEAVKGKLDLEPGDEVELRGWENTIAIGAEVYQVSDGAFFQANSGVAERLVEALLASMKLAGAERVLELFCGVGLFTVPMARRARHVLGVEGNPAAVADAKANLKRAGLADVAAAMAADVNSALRRRTIQDSRWDIIVLDPPVRAWSRKHWSRCFDWRRRASSMCHVNRQRLHVICALCATPATSFNKCSPLTCSHRRIMSKCSLRLFAQRLEQALILAIGRETEFSVKI